MWQGSGLGKLILAGEHFVVYGVRAVVAAVDRQLSISWEKGDEFELFFDEKISARDEEKILEAIFFVGRYFEGQDFKPQGRFYFKSNIYIGQGMGSSAALCVALVKLFEKKTARGFSKKEIFELAHETEHIFHGRSSGVDVAAALRGGFLEFNPGDLELIEPLSIAPKMALVLFSGQIGETKALVAQVKKFSQENPKIWQLILEEATDLMENISTSLQRQEWRQVGSLLTKNHSLLQRIGVSTFDLDRLVDLALQAGAWGAKLTGAGGGGNVLALVDSKKVSFVLDDLRKQGVEGQVVELGHILRRV